MVRVKKVTKSAAIQLLDLVWSSANKATEHSWERLNHGMRAALSLAIGAGLKFEEGDVAHVLSNYRSGYWIGESSEWIYSDAITVGNELALADWKTSNSVRVEYLIQVAAYGKLWEEAHPDMPLIGGYHIMRFGKPAHPDDPVHFSHHHWSQLDAAWQAFEHMHALYELNKRLGKMI